MKTSSVSRATSASRSADSHARTNFATSASSAGEPEAGGGSPAAGRRLPALQAGAGPFERAVDRFDGRVQHAGHLAGVESEDVAQDEDGELAGRQDLEGGDEGQGDGFGLLVAGLRAERHVDRTLEEGVRKRLQPDHLAEPGRLGRFHPGHVPLLGRAPAGRAARVEAPVGGDPVQPGAQRGAFLVEPAEALPGGQQRVLERRPRHPGRIRASGSSAPAAPGGAARSAPGTRRRPRPAPWRSGRLPPSRASPSSRTRSHFHPCTDTGRAANWAARRAPSFPASRCTHHRRPG